MFAPSQPKAQNDGSDGPGNTNVNGCPPPFPRQPCHRKTGDHRGLKPRQHALVRPPLFLPLFSLSLSSLVCVSLSPRAQNKGSDGPRTPHATGKTPPPPHHRQRGDLRGLKTRQHAVSVSLVPSPHFARAPLSLFSCVHLSRPRAQNKGSDGPGNPQATGKNPPPPCHCKRGDLLSLQPR